MAVGWVRPNRTPLLSGSRSLPVSVARLPDVCGLLLCLARSQAAPKLRVDSFGPGPLRPNNTFPVFATYLIPAASPPPSCGAPIAPPADGTRPSPKRRFSAGPPPAACTRHTAGGRLGPPAACHVHTASGRPPKIRQLPRGAWKNATQQPPAGRRLGEGRSFAGATI